MTQQRQQLHLRLPLDLHTALVKAAARKGWTLNQLAVEALRQHLRPLTPAREVQHAALEVRRVDLEREAFVANLEEALGRALKNNAAAAARATQEEL